MGLLDADSIAYAIGKAIEGFGGRVIYTVQNERLKRIFLDSSKKLTEEQLAALDIRYCDVTIEDIKTSYHISCASLARVAHYAQAVMPNAVSAGPLHTKAASKIPGFGQLSETWAKSSPLPWNALEDKQSVADAVVFLLGPHAAKITGQIMAVDGGASIVGGSLMDFERPSSSNL